MAVDALSPFADFNEASKAALHFLQAQLGLGLWIVTRTTGDDWIILGAANREPKYDHVQEGDVLRWADSFCSRMVRGEGPSIAASSADIAVYREAPIGKQLDIGAYVGLPLRTADGGLFGTLCAIDPLPQSSQIESAYPLLEVIGRLLASVLDRDLKVAAAARRAELAEVHAMRDELTGLWNRRAWDHFMTTEEARCRRYGHPAVLMSIDLDDLKIANDTEGHAAGDALLQRAAHALLRGVREQDVVARVGGDEFAILLIECVDDHGHVIERRLVEQLAAAGVRASIGFARRDPAKNLETAWTLADQAMYEQKRAHKARS